MPNYDDHVKVPGNVRALKQVVAMYAVPVTLGMELSRWAAFHRMTDRRGQRTYGTGVMSALSASFAWL